MGFSDFPARCLKTPSYSPASYGHATRKLLKPLWRLIQSDPRDGFIVRSLFLKWAVFENQ